MHVRCQRFLLWSMNVQNVWKNNIIASLPCTNKLKHIVNSFKENNTYFLKIFWAKYYLLVFYRLRFMYKIFRFLWLTFDGFCNFVFGLFCMMSIIIKGIRKSSGKIPWEIPYWLCKVGGKSPKHCGDLGIIFDRKTHWKHFMR